MSGVQVNGTLSYAPQVPWIQQATIRENIVFGSEYIEQRYNEVLRCCALDSDVAMLPLGDMTDIGEKGVNLSGGQKQRVSLARAAYCNSEIIVMDDILSAVDAHVGEHIFRNLICGFLRDRTRVLVTHQLSMVLAKADAVLCLGGMKKFNKPADITGNGASNEMQPELKISVPKCGLFSTESSVLTLCHPSRLGDNLRSVDLNLVCESTDAGFISILRELELHDTPVSVGDSIRPRQGSHASIVTFNGFPVLSTPDAGTSTMLDIPLDDYMDYPPPDLAYSGPNRPRLRSSSTDSAIPSANHSYDKLKCLGQDPIEVFILI